MPKKVIFCFAGTSDTGESCANTQDKADFTSDVIRIYIDGCQNENVGGGEKFPKLDIVANHIRNAFDGNGQLDTDLLKKYLGDGVKIVGMNEAEPGKIEVERIGLEGYSRGAVTTFAVAKKLNDLNIKMDIIANQPVPGEISKRSSLFAKYHDLSQCTNIERATMFFGSYTMDNGLLENTFYQQMLATFPTNTEVDTIGLPFDKHTQYDHQLDLVELHTKRKLHRYGYSNETPVNRFDNEISNWYREHSVCFTPTEFSQSILGATAPIPKDKFYLNSVREKAIRALDGINYNEEKLTADQLSAVVAVSQLGLERKVLELIVEDSDESKKFTAIVNNIEEVCKYLEYATWEKPKGNFTDNIKSQSIGTHSIPYKKEVFAQCVAFLTNKNIKDSDVTNFVNNIKNAEVAFENSALNIDRGTRRKAMSIVANTILHVTGLFLIANVLNKMITGDWFLFSRTRSSRVIKAKTNEVLEIKNTKQDKSVEKDISQTISFRDRASRIRREERNKEESKKSEVRPTETENKVKPNE